MTSRELERWMTSVGTAPLSTDATHLYGATMRRLRPLVALALVALISLSARAVARTHLPRPAPPAAPAPPAPAPPRSATDREKAVKFAECMRANGVRDFPDPDPKGEINFGVDVTPEVWTKAVDACKALKPPGALSSKRTPKEQSASLRFAQCVRDHGVKDFPDPVNGEPLIDTTKIPSSNKPGGMTILNAATNKCGGILKKSAGGQG